MEIWQHNRGTYDDDGFKESLEAMGVSMENWETIAPSLNEVMNGIDGEALNELFPILSSTGLRMILTDATVHVPPMRVAFREGNTAQGSITYISASYRFNNWTLDEE